MSDSQAVSKKCSAPGCGQTDVTEFSTCRFCGHKYADSKEWRAPNNGSSIGEFLRSPFNVLIGLTLAGTAYYVVTKHDLNNILGDTAAAVVNYGRKTESGKIAKYTASLNSNPMDVEAREKRADAYQEMLNGRAAVEDYTFAINIHPSANLYRKRAEAWDALGEYAKANADNAAASRIQ